MTAIQSSLSPDQMAGYTARQLNHFLPDPNPVEAEALKEGVEWTFERLHHLHQAVANRYYFRDGIPYFDHLHGDQYATYIYFLSRFCATQSGARDLAAKLYLLNKALFAVDIFFEVELPEIFLLCHPVGTVLGRASYEDYLVVSQNCTVGNIAGVYPKLGKGVVLCCGASVLGECELGEAVCVGAGSLLLDLQVPANHTVVGRAKDVRIIPEKEAKWRGYYNPVSAFR